MAAPKKYYYRGKWMTAKAVAEANGISAQALYSRMNAHKSLTAIEAAEMDTSRRGRRRMQVKHHAAGLSLTLNQWAEHLNVKYPTLIKWVRDEGIVAVVKRVQDGAKKARKEQSNKGKSRDFVPDIARFEFNPDLEIKRRIRAYRKQGIPDKIILDRERRAFGNGR